MLQLRAAQYDPVRGDVLFPGALGAAAGNRLFVVQFATKLGAEHRQALLTRGVEVVGYVPENAYLARCDRDVAEGLRKLDGVRWVGDLQVAFKLDAPLAPIVAGQQTAEPAVYNVMLTVKADRAALMAQIGAIGGVVTHPNEGSTHLQARLTDKQLAAVVALDTVKWIEADTPVGTDVDNARIQGGANYIETQGGFTGAGIRGEISEGVDNTHPDWTLPNIIRYDSNTDSHGQCTAGIVFGNGSGMAAARGMLPAGQLIESSYSVWRPSVSRYALIQGSVNPALPYRAMFQTASWGDALTTQYTAISAEMDNALFDFDFVLTQSQSNAGTQNSRPQAWAKNIISCGGLVHGNNPTPADDVWQGASIGPAADGRIKPDICAYYNLVLCADRVGAAGYSATNYYSSFSGTSSATPIVAGHVGLIQQMFTDGLFHNPLPLPATAGNRFVNRPHAMTVKALLTNTAASYPFTGTTHNLTRTHQGWGFPDVARLYDHRDRILVVDEYEALQQTQAREYTVWVPPGTPLFRATMSYADPEALAAAAIHRINNANLQVRQWTTGTTWWGNNGLTAGNVSTPGGIANDRDTLEQVWLANPASDVYFVRVEAPSVVLDARVETPQVDLDFALAVHPVAGFHDRSGIQFDLTSSGPGDARATCTNVPATGWTDGVTFLSFDTARPAGFGSLFGIEPDWVTVAAFNSTPTAGDVFRFTNAGSSFYPFAPHVFPPAATLVLSGLLVDGQVTLFNGTQIVAQSNVDRVQLQ